MRFRVTVGPVCGATTGRVCSGTVSGTKEQGETVATGPPAEACAPGGVGGAGKPRGTVSASAEKLEAVKVASSLGLQGPSAPIGAQLLATAGSEDAPSVYHANLLASSNASVLQQPVLASLNTPALASMQASAEANSLDIQAMQSMDWLFKKERIYLLAQFWQQVSSKCRITMCVVSSRVCPLSLFSLLSLSLSLYPRVHPSQCRETDNRDPLYPRPDSRSPEGKRHSPRGYTPRTLVASGPGGARTTLPPV